MDVQRAVRDQPEEDDRGAVHQDCSFPRHPRPSQLRSCPEAKDGRTPVPDALRLLLPRVEHRRDDHEPGRDRALADAEERAAREELPKVFRRGVAQQRNRPYEDVEAATDDTRGSALGLGLGLGRARRHGGRGGRGGDAPHPFPDGQVLQREVLRPLEPEEEEVEDRAQPVELRLVDVVFGAVSSGVARRTSQGVRGEGAGGRLGLELRQCQREKSEGGGRENANENGNSQKAQDGGLPERRLVCELHPANAKQIQIQISRVVSVRHVDRAAPRHEAERGTNM